MTTLSAEPLANLSVKKSNDFISAKYNATLLENQVMAIALTRIEVNAAEKEYPLQARLYPGELKRLVSDPVHIYRDLAKLANTIVGHTMFLEDGKGNFKAFSVIPNAEYQDGVFTIYFNNVLRDHVLGLEKNYTSLELSVMTGFKKSASFRLYEILKKEVYKIKGKDGFVQVEYNVYELRFMIGLANNDDEAVKKALTNMGKNVNWEVLYNKLDKKDKKNEEWRDFNRRVLVVAQKELEEKSDLRFEYKGIRDGHKITRILFTIYHNTPQNVEIIDEKQRLIEKNSKPFRQLEVPYDISPEIYDEFVGHNNLAKEDMDLLLKLANYDTSVVREKIEMADKRPHTDNYMGWLVRAIEGDYKETETIYGSAEQANKVAAVIQNYNETKSETAVRVWERVKKKEEYNDFILALADELDKPEQFEMFFDVQERLDIYYEWKKNGVISI